MNNENEKVKNAYNTWANNFPESFKRHDLDRFDNLVLLLLESGDYITETEIKNALKEHEEEWIADDYLDRFHTMSDTYNLMINNGYTKK